MDKSVWISYFGIRVTNLEKSIDFYTKVFNLVEIARGGGEISKWVLFKDPKSGQRLELNWYSDKSAYATPYVPGEGLDHIGVRVRSVADTLKRLASMGIKPSTKELGSNTDTWLLKSSLTLLTLRILTGTILSCMTIRRKLGETQFRRVAETP